MRYFSFSHYLILALMVSCMGENLRLTTMPTDEICPAVSATTLKGPLLASRIQSLAELKTIVGIQYFQDNEPSDSADLRNNMVYIKQCVSSAAISSVLQSGVSQQDIIDARDGNLWDRLNLLAQSPYTVANRSLLKDIYILARWRHDLYGWGDVAFYDLAETAAKKINTIDLAYLHPRDSSEKGYINTFNHVTAQAIITSCYSEEIADFIADAHERENMPELINGKFSKEQLLEIDDNPVDNYVDMINNEWGQEIGKQLKVKYGINSSTSWTPDLLTNYLNDLQSIYCWAFSIGMEPFRPGDEVVLRFSKKLNKVMQKRANVL